MLGEEGSGALGSFGDILDSGEIPSLTLGLSEVPALTLGLWVLGIAATRGEQRRPCHGHAVGGIRIGTSATARETHRRENGWPWRGERRNRWVRIPC